MERDAELARLRELGSKVPNWDGVEAFHREIMVSCWQLGFGPISLDDRMTLITEVCRRLRDEAADRSQEGRNLIPSGCQSIPVSGTPGCGAAWLARLPWEQEVVGSNPTAPNFRKSRTEVGVVLNNLLVRRYLGAASPTTSVRVLFCFFVCGFILLMGNTKWN